jgi:hypothetical protein
MVRGRRRLRARARDDDDARARRGVKRRRARRRFVSVVPPFRNLFSAARTRRIVVDRAIPRSFR